ncbi:hypothetical protein HK098_002495 [Nowakowskiella sp. JEL0407]|nr:hypothetical protein HK098_002495 [Nowakowskiella sp. JEL0407]
MTKSFEKILSSEEFDEFLAKAVSYVRWFLKVTQIEKTRERAQQLAGFDPGASFSGKFGEFLKSCGTPDSATEQSGTSIAAEPSGGNIIEDLFSSSIPIDSAKAAMKSALRQLGKSYCFLLLLISQCSAQPAKERFYFESATSKQQTPMESKKGISSDRSTRRTSIIAWANSQKPSKPRHFGTDEIKNSARSKTKKGVSHDFNIGRVDSDKERPLSGGSVGDKSSRQSSLDLSQEQYTGSVRKSAGGAGNNKTFTLKENQVQVESLVSDGMVEAPHIAAEDETKLEKKAVSLSSDSVAPSVKTRRK